MADINNLLAEKNVQLVSKLFNLLYCYCSGCWYHFNDSAVTPCDRETVARCKAYMLFYVRRDIKLPGYLTSKTG